MSDGELGIGAFLGFLKEKKGFWVIAAMLFLGVVLMLVGDVGQVGGSDRRLEERVEALCERIDGVSDVHVMITVDGEDRIRGAAVVCAGGDSPTVRLKLTEMLCALFEIPSSAVSVAEGK